MDSLEKIRSIHMPTLIIHGTSDAVVPPAMAEEIYNAAAGEPKKLYLVKGAGHENCAAVAGASYQLHMLEFLRSVPTPGAPRPTLTQ
jgi:uncharacterized protein